MIWGYIAWAVISWYAATQMAPRVNINGRKDDGTRTSKASTDAYIPKIYGKIGKHEGITVFKTTNDQDDDDTKNDLLHIIIVWSHAVHSIDQVYIDDIPWDDNAFLWDPEDTSPGAPRLAYVRNFTNGFNGYTDAALTAAGISATDTFDGKALSYIRLEYNHERRVFRGEPQITADITGTLTSNPAEHLQDYLTNAEYGKGLSTAFLDLTRFSDAIAFCNSQVPAYEGATETRPLFTSNIALDTEKNILENVNTLLKAMRGLMPIIDGKLSPIIEKDDPAVSFELTEDLIADFGQISNSNKNNRYNRVSVKYIEPEANWTSQEAVYSEANWVTEDNGVILEKTVELPTCTNYYEAGAFARAIAQISREQLRVQIEANPISAKLEVGDIVNVTHSYPGWNQKPFRVEITEQLPSGNVIFTLREHQPYLYDYYHTGDKPGIPDSSIVRTSPTTPTTATTIFSFDDYAQVVLGWTSIAQRFDYILYRVYDIGQQTETSEIVQKGTLATTQLFLNQLELGDYRFKVRARAGAGQVSEYLVSTFSLQEPPTPTQAPKIEITPGRITITPPQPTRSTMTYECVYTLDGDLTLLGLDADPISEFVDLGAGLTFPITTVIHGATYHIWYRLRSFEGYGQWVKVTAVGEAYYTWTVYADDADGTGISINDSSKAYVGYAYNRLTQTPDITDPTIYTWFPNTGNQWIVGSGAPSAALGLSGDNYLDDLTGDIYKKTSAGWGSPVGNIGADDGDKWLSGEGQPDPSIGNEGDWYIDTLTYDIYQKVAGAWNPNGTIKGADGLAGYNKAQIILYKRALNQPAPPTNDVTYTFATGGYSPAPDNGWYTDLASVPASDDALWVVVASAISQDDDDLIPANEWSAAVKLVEDGEQGVPGLNSATVFLFYVTSTEVPVPSPPGNLTYYFNTKTLTGTFNGWQQTIPAIAGKYRWMITATAASVLESDTIAGAEWSTPRVIAVDGEKGDKGDKGDQGEPGFDGAGFFTVAGSAWSDTLANTTVTANGRTKQLYDTVTITNSVDFSKTKFWNGASWEDVYLSIDGNFVVNGQAIIDSLAANAIQASKIDVTTLDVSQANWGGTVTINDTSQGVGNIPVVVNNSSSSYNSRGIQSSANNGGTAMVANTQGGRGLYVSANATNDQFTKAIEVNASAGAQGLYIGQTNPVGHAGNPSIYVGHASASYPAIEIGGGSGQTAIAASGYINASAGYRVNGVTLLNSNGATQLNGKTSSNYAGANTIVERDGNDINISGTYRINGVALKYVSRGTGSGQQTNNVHIGWGGTSNQRLLLQIDTSNFGYDWPINATVSSSRTVKNIYKRNTTALDDVCWLGQKGFIEYTYKDEQNPIPRMGLIAEEVEQRFPLAINHPNGLVTHKQMNYAVMVAPLFTAIYELNQDLEAKDTLINDLITRIEALENA